MAENLLNQIAEVISSNRLFAPALALLAGALTSLMPCSLASVPLIIGYVGGTGEKSAKKAFAYSGVFALGTAITFVTLGVIASSTGKLMGNSSSIWFIILGALMVLTALQTWGIYNFIPSIDLLSKNKRRGFIGAFLAGILSGLFSSPCSTPVLIALLAILSGNGNLLWGVLLMSLYSLGHSVPVLVAGTSVGFVQRIIGDEKYGAASLILKILMGAFILVIGLYMFYLGF